MENKTPAEAATIKPCTDGAWPSSTRVRAGVCGSGVPESKPGIRDSVVLRNFRAGSTSCAENVLLRCGAPCGAPSSDPRLANPNSERALRGAFLAKGCVWDWCWELGVGSSSFLAGAGSGAYSVAPVASS